MKGPYRSGHCLINEMVISTEKELHASTLCERLNHRLSRGAGVGVGAAGVGEGDEAFEVNFSDLVDQSQ